MKYIRPLSQTSLINDANLVSYWTLDGNANDNKGSNHGTSTAVIYDGQYGVFGHGGGFNGSNSKITLGSKLPIGVKTVSCWIKTTFKTDYGIIYDDCDGTTAKQGSGFQTTITSGFITWYSQKATSGTGRYSVTSNINVCDGVWHHVVGTWDGTTTASAVKLYIDGVLNATATSAAIESTSSTDYPVIGSMTVYSGYKFNGNLDDISIFNRALTAAEVSYLFAGESFTNNRPLSDTRFSGDTNLVSYWKLDGNSTDSKGTNHGTDTAITYGSQYGVFGQGCSFNGSTSTINSNYQPNFGTGSFTISLWFNTTVSQNNKWILGVYNDSSGGWVTIGIIQSANSLNNKIGLFIRDSNQVTTSTVSHPEFSPSTINDGLWHNALIAINRTTNYVYGYFDGVLVSSTSVTFTGNITTTDSLRFGSTADATNIPSNFWAGALDDISIFNRVLTYSEVQELYEREVTRTIYRPLAQTRFANDDNLVAYWKLDNNSTDSKGGFNGTDTAVTYVDGLFGKVASFNGSTSVIITTGMTTQLNKDLTFSCWVKSNNVVGAAGLMVSHVASYGNYWIFMGVINTSGVLSVSFEKYDGTNNPNTNAGTISAGVWYHVAGIKRGTLLEVYLNGKFISSVTDTTTSIPAYNQLQIGAQTVFSRNFNGLIDDASVFNRALSREEVAELYQSNTRGEYLPVLYKPQGGLYATSLINDASLVSYWKMDGNSRDSKGTNHGTDTAMNYSGAYGMFGQGGYFNGSSSKITFPTMSMGAVFTVSFWIKFTTTANGFIIGEAAPSGSLNSWFFITTAGSVYLYSKGTTEQTGIGTPVINDNKWHHCVGVITNNSSVTIYCDGIFIGTTVITTTFTYRALTIGYGDDTFWGAFNGNIDDVAIFNRALTAAEVFEIYSKGESSPLRPLDAIPALRQDSSLVSYWKLNGDAVDSKGTNNGTATNVTYVMGVNGRFGQAGTFNGVSSDVNIPSNLGITNGDITMSCWFYPNQTTSSNDHAAIFSHYDDTAKVDYRIFQYGVGVAVARHTPGVSWNDTNQVAVSVSTWYHVVLVYVGTTLKFYLNGVLKYSITATGTGTGTNTTLTSIGKGTATATSYFNGAVNDAAIFNRGLTSDEVYKLYTQGSTRGYWKLNGSSTDYSGNGNHGTDTAITYSQSNGVINQGALFNGSTSKINVGVTNGIGQKETDLFTASAWFKLNVLSGSHYIFSRLDAAFVNSRFGWALGSNVWDTNGLSFGFNKSQVIDEACSVNGILMINNWYNVVAVHDGTYLKLYLNGVLIKTTTRVFVGSTTNPNNLMIGSDKLGTSNFNGLIDEVIVEDRPWSASDVIKYYTNTVGNYPITKEFGTIKSGLSTYLNPAHLGSYPTTGTAWNDLIGANNATISDFSYSTNNGGVFTNSTQRYGAYGISYPLTNFPKRVGSMEIWAKPYSWVASNGLFVNRNDSTDGAFDWFWLGVWSAGSQLYLRIGSGTDSAINDITIQNWSTVHALNTWGLYTITWNSGVESKIYFNGVSRGTKTGLTAIPATNPSTSGRIGLGHNISPNSMWLGEIGIFDVYDRVLTADEVNSNFIANRSRYGI